MALKRLQVYFLIILIIIPAIYLHNSAETKFSLIIALVLINLFIIFFFSDLFKSLIFNSESLLFAVYLNSFFTLIIYDSYFITSSLVILDIIVVNCYILLLILSFTEDENLNNHRLFLLIYFTGFSYLYSFDFKSVIILFASYQAVSLITTILATKLELRANTNLPFLTKYSWINKIFVLRYYYSVVYLNFICEINKSYLHKFYFFSGLILIQIFFSFVLKFSLLAIIFCMFYSNLMLISAISCLGLERHPMILNHTLMNLSPKKRTYFTEKFPGIFNQTNLKLLAFSGTAASPWAVYIWREEQKANVRENAIARLSELDPELAKLAPSWVEELNYQIKYGNISKNHFENVSAMYQANMAIKEKQETLEERQKKIVDIIKGQLSDKEQQLLNKEQQLLNKEQQLLNKDQKLLNKDQQLSAKDQQLSAKDQELLLKNKQLSAKEEQLEYYKNKFKLQNNPDEINELGVGMANKDLDFFING